MTRYLRWAGSAIPCAYRRALAFVFLSLVCLSGPSTFAAPCTLNRVACENLLPGTPQEEWDIFGRADESILGFATEISVNVGETVRFKVDTDAHSYRIEIYRVGYYQGLGARLITTINPSVPLPQAQPNPITQPSTGLIDCGNWAQSASWSVPATAVSGFYIAKLVRNDTGGASHIYFIVREDARGSDLLFQMSDTTWHAYNGYGGRNLYDYLGTPNARALKVSYNRPVITRDSVAWASLFLAEYPMIRWIEANGFDVSYTSGVDTHRRGNLLLQHRAFLSVGHDEYWSAGQRAQVEAARAAGVHLAFFSGNEVFWKIRFEPSIDGSATPYRTMVCYKETKANAKIDPHPEWTGTWRDPRFSPPSDGGRPENLLTGTIFKVNGVTLNSLEVPAAYGAHRFWRNTSVATLQPGQVAVFAPGTLGFEWDEAPDNGPPGLMRLSLTTCTNVSVLQDYGNSYAPGQATHSLTLYRHASGALVFGAGTVQWSWGLDDVHDNSISTAADVRLRQATVNLFADMGAQPATLQPGLLPASPSSDVTPPSSVVVNPAQAAVVRPGVPITITGTASDSSGQVWGIEVSTDGGATWHSASGRSNWSYVWTPAVAGSFVIKSRALDDSGNIESPSAGTTVTVTSDQMSIWSSATVPGTVDGGHDLGIEVGVKFRSDLNGVITGIRFHKAPGNIGPHVGNLWLTNGTKLASATFVGETPSGWQQMNFTTPVNVTSNTIYVASYYCPQGHYSIDGNYFGSSEDNPPLHALANGLGTSNGVYAYAAQSVYPNKTYNAANYWVDVAFETALAINTVSLPNGVQDTAYSATLAAIGGHKPYTWSIVSGSLPPGLVLNPSTGAITGTATTRGFFSFVVRVRDDQSAEVTKSVTITVYSAPGLGIWSAAEGPGNIDGGADTPVELGVRFRSEVNGLVTGLRFYKHSKNVGTHVGHVWSSSGALLASATFNNESASGWQQVDLATPISVTANTVYVASYHCPKGHYSIDVDYFLTAKANPPLQALATGDSGSGNGVFVYGNSGTFPNQAYRAANYWVDVVFQAPLAITTVGLPGGTLDISYSATLAASSGKQPYTWSVAAGSLPPGLNLNPATGAITGVPTTTGTYNFTAQVSDSSNPAASATRQFSVTTYSAPGLTIWPASATPGVVDGGADNPVQLGVKFRSDVGGLITGIRFYKAGANTGTHVGSLWTSGGQLLASATFTAESSSGWQQVDFGSPVAISANTVYVASYHCPKGHYSIDIGYFGANGADNLPLHALANGEVGGNGVYIYGSASAFPTLTGGAANYWVDVVFQAPLAITTVGLPSGTLGISYSATMGASSGKTPYSWSVVAGSLPAGLSLNPSTGAITGTPTATGTNTFTIRVSDASNPANTATTQFSVTTYPALGLTIWPATATPGVVDGGADNAVQLGVKFRSDVSGLITGIRFYKAAANGGTHVGSLWTSSGTLLASATFTAESSSGWQQVDLGTPIAISANTVYVASYHCPGGHYSIDMGYLAGSGVDNPPLHALSNGEAGGNGVYIYGPATAFPGLTGGSANYWVDVVFQTPLAVSTTSLPNGNIGSTYSAMLGAVGGRTPYSWSVVAGSLPPGLVLNATSGAITGTPITTGTYAITIRVSDSGNPVNTATRNLSISVYGALATIWSPSATPSVVDGGADSPVQLGVKFRSDVSGVITGIRFYKAAANGGTHVGSLWTSGGALLASATFTSETSSGWQQVDFATPIAISADTVYVAAYHATGGHYSVNSQYFSVTGVDNPPLHALANGVSGGNGVYGYGGSNVFPGNSFNSANYWVDVVFVQNP